MSCKEIDMSGFPLSANRLIDKSNAMIIKKSTEKEKEKEKEKSTLIIIKSSSCQVNTEVEIDLDAAIEAEENEKKVIIQSLLIDVNQHQYIVDVAQLPAVQLCIREKIRGYRMQDVKKKIRRRIVHRF
jgi:hypothetical protein